MTGQPGGRYACEFLSHTIGDGTPVGHYGPEGGANFMDFGKAIKLWRGLHWLGITCSKLSP